MKRSAVSPPRGATPPVTKQRNLGSLPDYADMPLNRPLGLSMPRQRNLLEQYATHVPPPVYRTLIADITGEDVQMSKLREAAFKLGIASALAPLMLQASKLFATPYDVSESELRGLEKHLLRIGISPTLCNLEADGSSCSGNLMRLLEDLTYEDCQAGRASQCSQKSFDEDSSSHEDWAKQEISLLQHEVFRHTDENRWPDIVHLCKLALEEGTELASTGDLSEPFVAFFVAGVKTAYHKGRYAEYKNAMLLKGMRKLSERAEGQKQHAEGQKRHAEVQKQRPDRGAYSQRV